MLGWREMLAALQGRLGELFGRTDARQQAGLYLEGLLSAAERKNGWQLAEQIGDARPWRTQRVLSRTVWEAAMARDLCRSYVIEHLGADDGVLVIDETGFLKKGDKSAGPSTSSGGAAVQRHRWAGGELSDRRVFGLCQRARACANRPRTLSATGVGGG